MKLKATTNGGFNYLCPCGDYHHLTSGWKFNGDLDKPTFTPSVLVRAGHYVPGHKPGDNCWCAHNAEHPDDPWFSCYLCHSFVRDGMIQFLSDCTHPLAGQTVPMREFTRDRQ